jgi:hypothetical protein
MTPLRPEGSCRLVAVGLTTDLNKGCYVIAPTAT